MSRERSTWKLSATSTPTSSSIHVMIVLSSPAATAPTCQGRVMTVHGQVHDNKCSCSRASGVRVWHDLAQDVLDAQAGMPQHVWCARMCTEMEGFARLAALRSRVRSA